MTSNSRAALVDHVELDEGTGDEILQGVLEPQRPVTAGDEVRRGARVAAGEEGDVVAAADEFLGEHRDDALGAAVERRAAPPR